MMAYCVVTKFKATVTITSQRGELNKHLTRLSSNPGVKILRAAPVEQDRCARSVSIVKL